MKIENRPLRLQGYRLDAADSPEPVIVTAKQRIILPTHYKFLFACVQRGFTLSQISEEVLKQGGEWRFALIGRFLKFLHRAELLADREVIELVEGLEESKAPSAIKHFLSGFLKKASAKQDQINWSDLPLLRQLDETIRNELLKRAHEKSVGPGVSCIRQGQTDRSLFVVLEGKLAVARAFETRQGGEKGRRKVVAFLEKGAVFGEAAFFLGQPRTADVVAVETSRVLEIPHDDRMKNVELVRASDLQTRIWFLQALHGSPAFSKLPSDSLDALLSAGERRDYKAGSKIIQEGETADACYFIVQGRVAISQNMKALGKLQNGDAFGEIALMKPGTLRTATVTCETDVLTIRVESSKFWNLLKANLPLAIEVEKLAKRRLATDRGRR